MHTPKRATYIKIEYHILLIMMVKWVLKQALTSFVVMIMRQKKNPTHPTLRFHGVLGRHKFLESLIFRIYRQKLPTNKAYIKPSAKLLGHSKNMLIFDVAQPESTEVYRITKTDFIRFQFRHDVKNRL